MQISLNECEEVVSAVADKLEVLRALGKDQDALVTVAEATASERDNLLKSLISSRLQKVGVDYAPTTGEREDECQNKIARLGVEKEVIAGQISLLTAELENDEDSFQQMLIEEFSPPMQRLYQSWLSFHVEKAKESIRALLTPEAQSLQDGNIQQLAWLTQEVVNARQFEVYGTDVFNSPLRDTPARKFSEERSETFKLIEQAAEDAISRAKRLIEAVKTDGEFLQILSGNN
jgi:hypothetical protein